MLETESGRILFDCGMVQGGREADAQNRRAFAFDPRHVDAVVLSHAHLDHSGLLPRLARAGFTGPIYATPSTCDLLAIMLKDAAHLQLKDTEWENKWRRRAGKRLVAPLYTMEDAEQTLGLCEPVPYGEWQRANHDVEFCFRDAGHILGSAIVEASVQSDGRHRKLVFSGDLGNSCAALLRDPETVESADVLLMESTYGDRNHRPMSETLEEFAAALDAAAESGGNVIIPAFAVGRSQELLYRLGELYHAGRLRQSHVFLDSPMAIAATMVYRKHMEVFNKQDKAALHRAHAHNLQEWLPPLKFTESTEESIALNNISGGAIIIAGSGMCTGGRVRHHLKYNLWRHEAHIIISGFQVRGTPGRALVDGAKRLKLLGVPVAVKAHVHTPGGFSAHAGQDQLINWAAHFRGKRPRLYLVHGEIEKMETLQARLRSDLDWAAEMPQRGQAVEI